MIHNYTKKPVSEVARSLEKIALEKGLIKPEPVNSHKSPTEAFKTATALAPTDNLAENILKLCQGLRTQGFDKYATEIEVKFLQFKQADASGLYDVWHHGEPQSGEEVLHQAHPDGSHKMVDVDGDAVVEDLLEKQKKIQQVILKTPTGKLAAKDAVNIARIILADSGKTLDQINQELTQAWSQAKAAWKKIDNIIREKGGLSYVPTFGRAIDYWSYASRVDSEFEERPSLEGVDTLKTFLKTGALGSNIKSLIRPGWSGGISKDAWAMLNEGDDIDVLVDGLDHIGDLINEKIKKQREANQTPTAQTTPTVQTTPLPQASPEAQRLATLLGKVQASTKFKDDTQKGQVQSWLGGINQRLQNPQTAEKAKTELLDAEKSLAPYL